MTSPRVSIVVPSRGGAWRLPRLFEALRAQTYPMWEAVVVIDGDVDGSEKVVMAASADLPLHSIVFRANRGRAAALNAGFAGSSGEVIVRCDDDLVPAPNYVERHARAHEGRAVGVVGLYRNVFPDTSYARIYGRAWDVQYRAEAYASDPGSQWHYWAGNASVARTTWEQVGDYDESFRAYGYEDVDWGFRLAAAGIPIVLEPALETEHRIAATTCASRAQRAFYSGAARSRFERKHLLSDPPPPETPTLWGRAVARLAPVLTEQRAVVAGRAIDASSRVMPTRVARKTTALLVEASAQAGHRAASTSEKI